MGKTKGMARQGTVSFVPEICCISMLRYRALSYELALCVNPTSIVLVVHLFLLFATFFAFSVNIFPIESLTQFKVGHDFLGNRYNAAIILPKKPKTSLFRR